MLEKSESEKERTGMFQEILWPLVRAYNFCRNGKPKPRTQVGFESTGRERCVSQQELKQSVARKLRRKEIWDPYWNKPLNEEVCRRVDVWNKNRVLEKFLEAEALGDCMWFGELFCVFGFLMVAIANVVNRPSAGT